VTDTTFLELQSKLRDFWPTLTLRSIGDVERTVVVVHSISFDVPDHLIPVFPAYEERFLCLVLSLLRAPRSRVIYVTSQPIHPRLLDYYFGLVPDLDTPEARRRFFPVSLVDGRNEPLSSKLLMRPGAIRRIRSLIGNPELAFILPFCMTEHEVELAVRLGLPIYGCDPALLWLGTKKGSRKVFEEEGVPHPAGLEVDGEADVPGALREIKSRSPGACGAVLKLDKGVSGLGNALVDLEAAQADLRRWNRARRHGARPRRVPRRARRRGRNRRGAHRGRGLPEPQRATSDEPCGAGGHHVDPRPGPRRAA